MNERHFINTFYEDMQEFKKWEECTCCERHTNGRPFDAVTGAGIEFVSIDHILEDGRRCTALDEENGHCIPALHLKKKHVFPWSYTPKSKPMDTICHCNCRQRMRAIHAKYATVHCKKCV